MRLGGLFSGIGGFELAWTRAGGQVAWMCEIDRNARKVLAARFPGVPIYEDVEQLDPDEVEPVDVLTGGSPCQGFSMAGARTGMLHGESRLFADYLRILNGLEKRGLKWAVWENVPGVLSIRDKETGQRTFEEVVGGLAGADGPVRLDPKRKWNAGVAAGARRSVAWRVVDSRHFGVPQRRRRVYAAVAVGDSDGGRAGRAVLAFPEGMRGDPAACVTKGQAAPRSAARCSRGSGIPDAAQCLTTGTGLRYDPETETISPDVAGTPSAESSGGIDDLDRMTFIPDQPQAFNWQSGGDARGLDPTDNVSALTTQQTPAVLMTMREGKPGGGKGPLLSEEESLTLATGNGQTLFEPLPLDEGVSYDGFNRRLEVGVVRPITVGRDSSDFVIEPPVFAPPLTAANDPSRSPQSSEVTAQVQAVHAASYGVRRLTPVECERLQAFPDGWTEPAGSDSARYKALGNAITVNVASWLFGRMMEVGE